MRREDALLSQRRTVRGYAVGFSAMLVMKYLLRP